MTGHNKNKSLPLISWAILNPVFLSLVFGPILFVGSMIPKRICFNFVDCLPKPWFWVPCNRTRQERVAIDNGYFFRKAKLISD